MLEHLHLENFKGFKSLDFPLRPLTLLSGLNSSGKSSVLQALALLRQSALDGYLGSNPPRLALKGDLVALGTGTDVYFEYAESDKITFGISADNSKGEWRFSYDRNDRTSNVLQGGTYQKEGIVDPMESSLFDSNFHYLQAERIGPRISYDMDEYRVSEKNDIGTKGELTAHYLSLHMDTTVLIQMVHVNTGDEGSDKLFDQVELWLGEISPNTVLDLKPHEDMDIMQVVVGQRGSRVHRPTNVGFGILYTLPIIVALLSAQPNSLILLENPEAHLHPSGQSKMGELIARAASAGVQVIFETHSDHVLNGVRLAVKRDDIALSADEVQLAYFKQGGVAQPNTVETIQIDENGRYPDELPDGFFDEFSKVLLELW